jgi:hypothetical protein
VKATASSDYRAAVLAVVANKVRDL